ncbi:MAG: 30S ribosomal protein S20 [Planctomycetes bacterium]|nr:30S ribosomal protein S20 [Planctomycetota bacterium]
MPNSPSSQKRVRQNAKRNLINRAKASSMKTAMRRVDEAVEKGDKAAIESAVKVAYSRIDKAAKTNVIHKNTAARRKALVMRKIAKAAKAAS